MPLSLSNTSFCFRKFPAVRVCDELVDFQGLLIYEVKINILLSDKSGVQLSVEQMLCFSLYIKKRDVHIMIQEVDQYK